MIPLAFILGALLFATGVGLGATLSYRLARGCTPLPPLPKRAAPPEVEDEPPLKMTPTDPRYL